jgi:uncharacterized membrane protein
MSNNAQLKNSAKSALQGKWGAAALATLVMWLIIGAASSIAFLSLVISGPMCLGFALYLREIKNGNQPKMETLFAGFSSSFMNSMVAGIMISLIVGLGVMLLFIPFVIFLIPYGTILLFKIAFLIAIFLLIIPVIILSLPFAMTFFIIADDKNISGLDALKRSWTMMRGHKCRLFGLAMRFFGWLLLGLVTFGIAWLWAAPYFELAFLNFYDDLKDKTIEKEII